MKAIMGRCRWMFVVMMAFFMSLSPGCNPDGSGTYKPGSATGTELNPHSGANGAEVNPDSGDASGSENDTLATGSHGSAGHGATHAGAGDRNREEDRESGGEDEDTDHDKNSDNGSDQLDATDEGENEQNAPKNRRNLSEGERNMLRNLQNGEEFSLPMPEGHSLYLRVDRRSSIMTGILSLSGSFRNRNDGNWNLSLNNETITGSVSDYERNLLHYIRTDRETGQWFIESIDLRDQNLLQGGEPLQG
jgi:hypothetical protein